MARTRDEETDEQRVRPTLSFVMSDAPSRVEDDEETTEDEDRRMHPAAALAGTAMGVAAVICLTLGLFTTGPGDVDQHTGQQLASLRSQVRTVQGRFDDLPDSKDASRQIETAKSSADDVARMQNDYRALAPEVSRSHGELGSSRTLDTSRSLSPYFSPDVDASVLQPWYLLEADKVVPAGTGMPMGFASGFQWQAQTPTSVEKDGSIRVTWLAVQTRTAPDETPAVLAWARADYDTTTKTFGHVVVATTSTGEDLRMQVKAS